MSADIGNMRVGQAPQGIKPPSAPASAKTPATIPPPQPSVPAPTIIVPPPTASGPGIGRKALYVVLAALIIAGIIYSIASLLGDSDTAPTATNTPTTSTSPAETLGGKNLRSYFGNPVSTITLGGAQTAPDDFRDGLVSIQPTAKLGTVISVAMDGATQRNTAVIENLFGNSPASLTSIIGSDWLALAYGQTEMFSSSGIRSETTTTQTRAAFVFEITDASGASQAMLAWENTGLATASATLFGYDSSLRLVNGFSAGVYRTIPVRYWNFPYADRSIDYALVTASNNKNYLILSSSRESIFFIIDQLMQ